jgi:hypothetical protein
VIDGAFKLCRFSAEIPPPPALFQLPHYSISRIGDELSIVVPEAFQIDCDTVEGGWAMLGVIGTLDFGLTGILAGIAAVLAAAEISLFALSTYDTDYILVKQRNLQNAVAALRAADYIILD